MATIMAKKTNNHLQNSRQKLKIRQHEPHKTNRGELREFLFLVQQRDSLYTRVIVVM
jgi:hypothetical protein